FGPLETGHAQVVHGGAEVVQEDRWAGLGDDVEADAFAEHGVGHGDRGDLTDVEQLVHEVLDLFRGDLLPAAVDHVLVASFDDEVSGGRHPADVAGAVPAVGG